MDLQSAFIFITIFCIFPVGIRTCDPSRHPEKASREATFPVISTHIKMRDT